MKKPLNQILKILTGLLPIFVIVLTVCSLNFLDYAAATPPAITVPENLCGEGAFPCPEGGPGKGIEQAQALAVSVAGNLRNIIGAVCIIVIFIAGVKLIAARGDQEVFTKQTETLKYAVIGLFIIGLAGDLAQVFDVKGGGFLKDPSTAIQRAKLFNRSTEIIITFIKYIVGSLAVLFTVRNGLRLVLVGGDEEEVAKDKKNFFYGFIGIVFIIMANPIVNKIFFKIDMDKYPGLQPVQPGVDPQRLIAEITGMTNLIAAIAGPVALLALVAGGLMYIVAAGEDEKITKAKKIITWSILGLFIIYGAFAIVSTFVARQFTGL